MRPAGAFGWLGRCAALLALVLLAGCQAWRSTAVAEIQTAVKITQDPHFGDTWHSVSLPDVWPDGAAASSASYVVRFASSPSLRPQAVLLLRVGNFVGVRLNGQPIAQLDQPPSVLQDAVSAPVMLYLPDALLAADNVLEFRITGRGGAGAGLSQVMVGPANQIERLYGVRWSLSIGLLIVMLTAGLFVAMFATLLWRGTREPVYLALTGAAALLVAYATMLLAWDNMPIGWWAAAAVIASYHSYISLVAFCAFRMLGARTARVARLVLAYWVALTGSVAVSALAESMTPYVTVRLLSLVLVVYGLAQVARIAFKRRSLTAWLLLGTALLGIVHALQDVLGSSVGHASYGALPLHRLTAPGFMFTVIVFIVEQYTRSFGKLRRLNQTLEQRVATAQQELAHAFESLREAEQTAAVEQERRRMMRDIHDGLGSQLVATLSLASQPDAHREEILGAVEVCITELRVAIDSLEPFEDDLLAALGTLRTRVEPLLARSGLRLGWRVRELPAEPHLTSAQVADLFRLLIEVFTNVVKHSGADHVTLQCTALPRVSCIWVSVFDNGRGLPAPEQRRAGRGLGNMRERAARIGAHLSVRSRGRGTLVRLAWTMAPHEVREVAGSAAGSSAGRAGRTADAARAPDRAT